MKDTGKMVSALWHEYEKAIFMEMWERESSCSRGGTFGSKSAVRKRGFARKQQTHASYKNLNTSGI